MKKFFTYCILCIFFFSCTKEIKIEPKDFQEKLVLNGMLSADSVLRIKLLKTVSVNASQSEEPVDGAKVRLYQNGVLLGELSGLGDGKYQYPIFPNKNKVYRVLVETTETTCEADDLIPDTVRIKSVKVDTVPFLKGQDFLQFTFSPTNIPNINEYYEISALLKIRTYSTFGNTIIDSVDEVRDVNLSSLDPFILANANNSNYKTQFLFSDKGLGVNSAIKIGTYDVRDLPSNSKALSCTLVLKSLSKESFDYFNSLYNHIYYRSDPFSLPVKVQSNVFNGYGILGGFSENQYVINF